MNAQLVVTNTQTPVQLVQNVLMGGGVNAVSYTHLRAHETVLDLVCRLLLEKKKNNRHQHNSSSMNNYTKDINTHRPSK